LGHSVYVIINNLAEAKGMPPPICMYCTAPLSPRRGALEVFMMKMMMMNIAFGLV